MIQPLPLVPSPELFIGLVAPIGADLDVVIRAIKNALHELRYKSEEIRITQLMRSIPINEPLSDGPFIKSYKDRINYANRVRKSLGNDALAALAISGLRDLRKRKNEKMDASEVADPYRPLPGHAYIIRQFKRPEEIMLLRRVYGRQFFLISAYAPPTARVAVIAAKEARSDPLRSSQADNELEANALVAQDSKEQTNANGQNVRDAFPLADVIVDASAATTCEAQIRRFFHLVFGSNKITPTRQEYGMYLAKSAALRTSDLSRQVGAAIFSRFHEVAALGANEVPRAYGGTYWPDDQNDSRDWVRGYDPNDQRQQEILADIIDRLSAGGHLAEKHGQASTSDVLRSLLSEQGERSVAGSMIMDLLEFGRVIHAEMCAITDAARRGIPIHGESLYCTTFPCHICAKHIGAAGLHKVVYLEPYQKSYASRLHADSISVDVEMEGKVSFSTFIGVSPHRYRDLFERPAKRKDADGSFKEWLAGQPRPNLELYYPAYREAEERIAAHFNARLREAFIES